jgi:hypothetical protein
MGLIPMLQMDWVEPGLRHLLQESVQERLQEEP